MAKQESTDPDSRSSGLTVAEQEQLLDALEAALDGDFSARMRIRRQGVAGELARSFNELMRRNDAVTAEVDRINRRVGREGRLNERASIGQVQGGWAGQVDAINQLIDHLVQPIGEVARVLSAVAEGDLSRRLSLESGDGHLKGEFLRIGRSVNATVDQLSAFADEVTRVAREVGTEGKLGGQARVQGASGTWKDLTDNVNSMARNLTDQVRNIAEVTTAVAQGDLSRKITVDARGEILELKSTINTMVDQLSSFADEVTRVAREVGTEGKLGGQATVVGVSGTWEDLTDNVNLLAANLTTQVRAIAEVSTAVTRGDLSQRIEVEASGEVAELKNTINQMIVNLSETTEQNTAQDWLKSNIASISTMLQGQRDVRTVGTQIMSHVTPLVDAHSGAFFYPDRDAEDHDSDPHLRLLASYATTDHHLPASRVRLGEGLVGQVALERTSILVTDAPPGYLVRSGLGEAAPVNVLVIPIQFEGELMGVLEFASLVPFTDSSRQLLDELVETLGIVLHTIEATTRTEVLLVQSQDLTQELQAQSEELQSQQEELQQTNEELEEKAELLEAQKRAIELTNAEIERARHEVEERAEQLALASRYKSEFLANMSHELRTPLNSMLILSRLLADEDDGLTSEQREFAETIHATGNDLLDLINDILDLSKIEAGRMDVTPSTVSVAEVVGPVRQSLEQVAADKGLPLHVTLDEPPVELYTDVRRLQQILKNLVSNAIKFTEQGEVRLEVTTEVDRADVPPMLRSTDVIAFHVADTGVGISEELQHVVFEAFRQGDGSRSRRHGGTGLGLSISRELAALLGGSLALDSTLGVGTTFSLYLPLTYAPVGEEGPEPDVVPDHSSELTPIALPPEDAGDAVPRPAAAATPVRSGGEPAPEGVTDDRDVLRPGDPALVAMVPDEAEAERIVELAHTAGHRIVVARDRTAGFALAAGFRPSGILLRGESPSETLATLTYLKRRRETRHVPVAVVVPAELEQDALRAAAAFAVDDPDDADLAAVVDRVMSLGLDDSRKVLVVEDDETSRHAVSSLLGRAEGVQVVAVDRASAARAELDEGDVDLLVLDLQLADGDGFELLEELRGVDELSTLPVVIHTGKDLSHEEESQLLRYAKSIVMKTVGSPARLLDETLLHLHRAPTALPDEDRQLLEELYAGDDALRGKHALVVDDDARSTFALARGLEAQGMQVTTAEDGREALDRLRDPAARFDLVLMDIMMPEMDGHEATRRIRALPAYADLPIITLTAKAMREDRAESLAAGASDFITKPVDIRQLVSLVRVWLYR